MIVKIVDNTDKVKSQLESKMRKIFEGLGSELEGEAMDELENSPRRVDTANLQIHITHEVDESEPACYIGTNVKYGIYVHEGTRRMDPNRFLKNAVVHNKDEIKKYIENGLKGEEV